jgi:hypothetical protein
VNVRVVAAITALLGIAAGLYLLFGETGVRCTAATIGQTAIGQPVETLAPGRCVSTRMIDVQPVWPMPLLAFAVWSLAPLLAVAGTWQLPPRMSLVTTALVVEATSLISFGAAPVYVPLVLVPLAITWVLARSAARAHARPGNGDASRVR